MILTAHKLGNSSIYSFKNDDYPNPKTVLTVQLTAEQEEKLTANSGQGIFSTFLHPEQILSYFCDNCKIIIEEKPSMQAYIRTMHSTKRDIAETLYVCKKCNTTFYPGLAENPANIPVEFIAYDATGNYKKPTPESIEELLAQAEKRATEAFLDKDSIATCRRWAQKIEYKLDEERIKQINVTQRQAYLRNFEKNLPELIEEIRKDSYAFQLGTSASEEECSMFEGTGLAENVYGLLENLPHINLPEDNKLRQQILKILFQYRKMYDNAITQTINEKAEMEKKFNDEIQSCQNVSRKTTHLIAQYCERAGIDKETLDKIADDATIPFPLDEIEDDTEYDTID